MTPASALTLHFGMPFWFLVDAVTPYVRAATAVAPFSAALALRWFMGRNRATAWLLSLATMWFLVNVILAPYSPGMRDDLRRVWLALR